MDFPHIQEIFEQQGGRFLTSSAVLEKKVSQCRTLIFDWDGVFHAGTKSHSGHSTFSEADSMAINMLRFGIFLQTGEMPKTVIVTGEANVSAQSFAKREHFDAVFFNSKDKLVALEYLKEEFGVKASESAFFFDDILDLSLAKRVGIRFLMGRKGNPLFNEYVSEHQLADYITAQAGGQHGIREASELALGMMERFVETTEKRMDFHPDYSSYWNSRQAQTTRYFRLEGKEVTEILE